MIKTAAATLCCLIALLSLAQADTPLELSMKATSKAFKQLNLDLKAPVDASKPDYLALVDTLKTEAQKSRALVPQKAAALPADQQAAMVTAYQKSIDDLTASYDTLSQSIQAGQWDAARATMAKILDQEKQGHKEFRVHKSDAPVAAPTPTLTNPSTTTPAPAPANTPAQ
jgi:soluble cytochrome b562